MGGMLWIPISYLRGHTLSKTTTESEKGVKKGPKSVVIIYCLNAVGKGKGVKKWHTHYMSYLMYGPYAENIKATFEVTIFIE